MATRWWRLTDWVLLLGRNVALVPEWVTRLVSHRPGVGGGERAAIRSVCWTADSQDQSSSRRRASPMPKWCPISWSNVARTWRAKSSVVLAH